MTLQDLKDSRNEIIAHIQNKYGSENLKQLMTECVGYIGFNGIRSTDVISYVDEVAELVEMVKPRTFDNSASNWLAAKNRENAFKARPSSMR